MTNIARGISQIFFINNPVTGVLIAVALAVVDPRLSLLVILGATIQTLGAYVMRFDEDIINNGMMGYNGALVGAAAALFTGFSWLAVSLTIIGAFACVVVHEGLRRLFGSSYLQRYGLPVSTAPFCLVASIIFGALGSLVDTSPLSSGSGVLGLELGLTNSFSEVVLADGWLSGLIILIALFIGSWQISLWGLVGAVIAVAISSGMHGVTEVSTGLYSYCAVLVAIACGVVLWPNRSLWERAVAAVVGVLLTLPIQAGLAMTPIPVFTWPFIVAMWIVVMVSGVRFTRLEA